MCLISDDELLPPDLPEDVTLIESLSEMDKSWNSELHLAPGGADHGGEGLSWGRSR